MAEIALTDKTFAEEVTKSSLPVLVDFWATWCGPCQMQNPILKEIAEEFAEKIKVGKLNVDENPQTASKYGIMSIPTLVLFQNGNALKHMIGVQSKETLKTEIKAVLNQK